MRFNEFKIIEPSSSSDGSVEPKYVLVQKRDNLTRIAKALTIPLADLIAANPQIQNINLIHPGDKIKVPGNTAPNPVYPEIPHSHPRREPTTSKDDGSFDNAEKRRLANHPAGKTEPKDDGSFDNAEKNRLGNHPAKASEPPVVPPVVPPKDTTDDKTGGRGKINPEPLGKGKYKINDYTTAWHIFNFFKKNGFNDVQSAAITANAYVEGLYQGVEFNTKAKGDFDKITKTIPTAFGIFQWRLTRYAGLRTFALTHKKSWTDLDLQLDYAMEELKNNFSGVVTSLNSGKNKTDIASATQIFMREYENPSHNPSENHYEDRLGYAKTILDAFGTKQDKRPAQ
jgi:LysM repeat protein